MVGEYQQGEETYPSISGRLRNSVVLCGIPGSENLDPETGSFPEVMPALILGIEFGLIP